MGIISETLSVLPVVERFVSINGEGQNAGKLSAFVRLLGCNLGCSYCDTSWANVPDCPVDWLSPRQICDWVAQQGVRYVTLTGGEPLLHPAALDLCALLLEDGSLPDDLTVEVETNGSIPLSEVSRLRTPCPDRRKLTFTMDWKLPSSGMESNMLVDNFDVLTRDDVVKFVAGDQSDLQECLRVVQEFGLQERCNVYLSPVYGVMDPSALVDFAKQEKLYRVCIQVQLHKIIWPKVERGV